VEPSPQSDVKVVHLRYSDEDIGWGEITDDDAVAESLQCEGLFSEDDEGQNWIRRVTCWKWVYIDFIHFKINEFVSDG
jgi:hypothetical protein